jgi:hypothetical protein
MLFPAPEPAPAHAPAPCFIVKTLEALTIDDEASFRHVGLYADLKRALQDDGYRFRVLPETHAGRWDRAVALNLTFWGADDGGDVLVDSHIPADVVAHVAWHHLTARALGTKSGERASADVLFLGESIASAFDVYLVGRLLGHAPQSSFLESQVPAMADAAAEAGLDEEAFEALLAGIAADPDRAFDDLRALLFDASRALVGCDGAEAALAVLTSLDGHRFGPLLHRYELSNWVLYARAYATAVTDTRALAVDRALREGNGLEWLTREWIDPPRATT